MKINKPEKEDKQLVGAQQKATETQTYANTFTQHVISNSPQWR